MVLKIILAAITSATCFVTAAQNKKPAAGHNDSLIIRDGNYIIVNNEKVISNEMIFYSPFEFPKNRRPLILVNGNPVSCLTYYNREELQKITVLQPAEAQKRLGKPGRNGAILAELKSTVIKPGIEVVSNKIHYRCKVNGRMADTSKAYFIKVMGKDCQALDLRDTAAIPSLYIGFDNEIKIKNLGVGWDMTSIAVSGGFISGTSGNRMIRVSKKGQVKILINTCKNYKDCSNSETTEILFNAVPLPDLKND